MNQTKDVLLEQKDAKIKELEKQLWQLTQQRHSRPAGTLPSDTEVPPRRSNIEQCKMIELRSGKQLEGNSKSAAFETDKLQVENSTKEAANPQPHEGTSGQKRAVEEQQTDAAPQQPESTPTPAAVTQKAPPAERPYPPVPFPQRLKNKKLDIQFSKFLEVFKKLQINIPFAEALEQMPSYAKFMKEMLSKKKKLGDYETVALTEECSAILQNKLPPKLKDPGSFNIPVILGNKFSGNALCDLGASINLMPLSIYNQLGLGEPKPTSVTLQLADRSMTYPRGIVEDVLVKVGKFIFPVDFIVLDYEAAYDAPLLLGRPFLATGRALIDVEKGELKMRVLEEEVTFNVFTSSEHKEDDSKECLRIDTEVSTTKYTSSKEQIQKFLQQEACTEKTKEKQKEFAYHSNPSPSMPLGISIFKSLQLKLKPLPAHLKYVYLDDNNSVPIIVSASLSDVQEAKLLRQLRISQITEKWSVVDLRDIQIGADEFEEEQILTKKEEPSVDTKANKGGGKEKVEIHKPPWSMKELAATENKFGGVLPPASHSPKPP